MVRWHARYAREVRGVTVGDASLALAALASMESRFAAGAAALQQLCVAHGREDLAQVQIEHSTITGSTTGRG